MEACRLFNQAVPIPVVWSSMGGVVIVVLATLGRCSKQFEVDSK